MCHAVLRLGGSPCSPFFPASSLPADTTGEGELECEGRGRRERERERRQMLDGHSRRHPPDPRSARLRQRPNLPSTAMPRCCPEAGDKPRPGYYCILSYTLYAQSTAQRADQARQPCGKSPPRWRRPCAPGAGSRAPTSSARGTPCRGQAGRLRKRAGRGMGGCGRGGREGGKRY